MIKIIDWLLINITITPISSKCYCTPHANYSTKNNPHKYQWNYYWVSSNQIMSVKFNKFFSRFDAMIKCVFFNWNSTRLCLWGAYINKMNYVYVKECNLTNVCFVVFSYWENIPIILFECVLLKHINKIYRNIPW